MGTWGTGISSNDTFGDIYYKFFELYNEGKEPHEISHILINQNQEIINDKDDSHNFWFALAKAQWECKSLNLEVLKKVENIIKSGKDIEVWKSLEATTLDLRKRKIALDKFLEKIKSEKTSPKQRKKKKIKQPVFEKGDCITFKLANGNYGGAIVLEAIKDTEYGYNLIVATRLNQKVKPATKDFIDSEVLIINHANWKEETAIKWYLPIRHNNVKHLIEIIGNIEVGLDYNIDNSHFGFVSDFDIWIIELIDSQFISERTKPRPTKKKKVKNLIKRKKWGLW